MVKDKPLTVSRNFLESDALEGDSPVCETVEVYFERVGLPRLEVRIWQD